MAYKGYFTYDGQEVINATRTKAYADALGMYWVKDTGGASSLPRLLGQAPYAHPALDVAPWYDPDVPESAQFAGVIPVSVTGIEDSTRESEVFEYTTPGGNPGSLRDATKTVVFSVALIGMNEASVEYGFRWLKRVLKRRNCTPGTVGACRGADLYYARYAPPDDDVAPDLGIYDGGGPTPGLGMGLVDAQPDGALLDGGGIGVAYDGTLTSQWITDYERHLTNVLFNRGPVINSQRNLPGCNGAVWMVSFTGVAGDPLEYGHAMPVLRDMIATVDSGQSPYVDGLTGSTGVATFTPGGCPVPVTSPIFDPLYSPVTPPPSLPDIVPGGWVNPTGPQVRVYAEIPDSEVPLWDEVCPRISLTNGATEQRMVRVRFFEGDVDPDEDCDSVGEFGVSYLPPYYTLVIDTAARAIYAYSTDGVVRRADSLVYGANAKPINWFGLSCGDAYLMTVDAKTIVAGTFDVDLDLIPRSA